MMLFFLTGKREQDVYMKAFSCATPGKVVSTQHFVHIESAYKNEPKKIKKKSILPSYNSIAFSGLLRGNSHLLDLALSKNLDFYYVDHAYLNSGYKYPHWMRVIKNGFVQNTIIPDVDQKRLQQNFDIKFNDYKFREKKNIIVLPPSNTVARVFNQLDWETKTIENIRKHTDRPIVVRRKSGPVMDDLLVNVASKENYEYEESIDEALGNAYCVVAFNSAVALTALRKGVPVICERYCPAFPLSHSFEQIENLSEKERLPLFASLAWGQFTMEEIRDPKTFDCINKTIQWKGRMK
jgi:hypothetical protein